VVAVSLSHYIPDVFHNAHNRVIPLWTGADGTDPGIRNIMTITAIDDLIPQLNDGFTECFHFGSILFEKMQCQPQGCFPADARELCQFADGVFQ